MLWDIVYPQLCEKAPELVRQYNIPVVPHKAVAEVSKIGNL